MVKSIYGDFKGLALERIFLTVLKKSEHDNGWGTVWNLQALPYNWRARNRKPYYPPGYYVAGDFDSRLYGYKKLSDLVKIKTDLFET